LVYLQVVKGDALRGSAQDARQNFSVILARRGDIVDTKGNLLATTRSLVDVGVDPQEVRDEDLPKVSKLAELLEVSEVSVLQAFSKKTRQGNNFNGEVRPIRWTKIAEDVEEDVYQRLLKLKIKGVYGNFKHSRLYPGSKLASHVIGFVNKEGTPSMGVEKTVDYYLRGQAGWRECERDGRRRELLQYRSREVPSKNGLNVELSIDRMIQDMVERELASIVEEYNPLSASIIVSEPSTGYVLAMANAPDFDPNKFNDYEMGNLRNRTMTDVYEPGSVFKIVAAGGAMNENLVSGDSIIDCSTSITMRGSRKYRLPRDDHSLGKITVEEVVVHSSNRGAAQLGIMLGSSRFYEYCKSFGFGARTGVGFRGERKGTLHHPKSWDGLTITRMPMGHAVSVTPMQMHSAMAVVASNGILMKPQVVKRVFDSEGKTVVEFKPRSVRRVLRSEVAENLTGMLAKVVSEGTAKRAKIKGYYVAGKTGTTKKIIEGQYSNRHHIASFVGFLPANDPRIVISVIVDEPKMKQGRIGYGGSVAGPSFQRIGKDVISYLGVSPNQVSEELTALGNRITRAL
jgi:cell division protein FtsI/penicillin-binding protein 2